MFLSFSPYCHLLVYGISIISLTLGRFTAYFVSLFFLSWVGLWFCFIIFLFPYPGSVYGLLLIFLLPFWPSDRCLFGSAFSDCVGGSHLHFPLDIVWCHNLSSLLLLLLLLWL